MIDIDRDDRYCFMSMYYLRSIIVVQEEPNKDNVITLRY